MTTARTDAEEAEIAEDARKINAAQAATEAQIDAAIRDVTRRVAALGTTFDEQLLAGSLIVLERTSHWAAFNERQVGALGAAELLKQVHYLTLLMLVCLDHADVVGLAEVSQGLGAVLDEQMPGWNEQAELAMGPNWRNWAPTRPAYPPLPAETL